MSLAGAMGGDVLFVATAAATDDEMRRRIARHRAERPGHWRTIEATRNPAAAVELELGGDVVLLDCVTLLISNILLDLGDFDDPTAVESEMDREVDAVIEAARNCERPWIVVSNEVGGGIVPQNPLARLFRDLQGRANQQLAAAAGKVVLMVAGIAVEVKS